MRVLRLLLVVISVALIAAHASAADLVYMSWDGGVIGEAKMAAVDEWNRLNPNTQVTYLVGGYEKIKTLIAAGDTPDLMHLNVAEVQELAAAGVLLHLDEYMARDGAARNYFAPALQALSLAGRVYALPNEGGPRLLYVNKQLFLEAGVAPPTPNWDRDIYEQAAKKVTRRGPDGAVTHYGTNDRQAWDHWLYSASGKGVFDASRRTTIFSHPGIVETLDWIAGMTVDVGVSVPVGLGGFYDKGQLAMGNGVRANWLAQQKNLPFDWTMELMPKVRGQFTPYLFINGVSVSASTKDRDEAWRALSWFLGVEGWVARLRHGKQVGVPLNTRAISNELYLSTGNPQITREQNMRFAMAVAEGLTVPSLPEWKSLVDGIINPILTQVWKKELSARAAAEMIDSQVQALLAGETQR